MEPNFGRVPEFAVKDREEAWRRGLRVVEALREGDAEAVRQELGEYILLEGRVSGEAMHGIGHDFRSGDVFVRVYGPRPDFSLKRIEPCASVNVSVLGRLTNAYLENLLLVMSVEDGDYAITGSS